MKFFATVAGAAILLASAVSASPLTARAAEYGKTTRRTAGGLMRNHTSPSDEPRKADQYSSNWAGAVIVSSGVSLATGTFTVPTPSPPPGGSSTTQYCGAAWVGIDGDTCQSGLIQTGVFWCVQNGEYSYEAWYEWIPGASIAYNNINVNAGDVISVTVTWTSDTSGTVYLVDETNGGNGFIDFTGQTSGTLCGTNAEWIVEDFEVGNSLVAFADFGSVTFTGATAVVGGQTVSAGGAGAETIDLVNSNGQVITSTNIDGSTVTITYE
jgi:hypothetical protein